MRIAFLTPEYPSETASHGGLATYVARMSRLLVEAGHTPEVFVTSTTDETLQHDGVRVHRVDPGKARGVIPWRLARLTRAPALEKLVRWTRQARALAAALERRQAEAPFDLVQSADYTAPGLYVPRLAGRVHAVRCSSAADLYDAADGPRDATARLRGLLERTSMRRADLAYAPSRFLAEHFRGRHGMAVRVIRPPAAPTIAPDPSGRALPERYLVHFGQLMPRKGTEVIARALPIAWKTAPDLRMVWSGVCWNEKALAAWIASFGDKADQVLVTGPLERRELAAVVGGAVAAVLPSMVDNLPNTVIESLSAGVPVIGTAGASIDEIVEEGVTGRLVRFGDLEALGEAMVEAWTGAARARRGFVWTGGLRREMEPEVAVASLLALAGRKDGA